MDNARSLGVESGTGLSKNPSSFVVDAIVMTNYKNESVDISKLMSTLAIIESLNSSCLVMDLLLVDQMNFFEDFNITGQEKISIALSTKYKLFGKLIEKSIALTFSVTEYPEYNRLDAQTQTYRVQGVTEHGYISPLKKISKVIKGPVTDTIADILANDLNVKRISVNGNCSSAMTGVVPIQSPLKAITWLRDKAYDQDNTPFFVYQTLDGTVNVTSLGYMMDQDPYRRYVYSTSAGTQILTDEDFVTRQITITSINSNLNLAKSYNLADGAYASKARFIDLSNNTLRENNFDHSVNMKPSLNGDVDTVSLTTINVNRPEENATSLNKMTGANLSYVHVSNNTYDGHVSAGKIDETRLQYAKSWHRKFETVTQSIVIPGDFDLRAGYVVELKIPKGINPGVYKSYTGKSATNMDDTAMGGKYIVFALAHIFNNGAYNITAELRKDSVPG